jgi:hypothetical protein
MTLRRDVFIDVSAALTGFSRVRLLGTGMSGTYLNELDAILPNGMLDRLLRAFQRSPQDAEEATVEAILQDASLGPVARNIMLLWYCGTWTAFPDSWRADHGAAPGDTTHVVSGEAYQAALQWVLVGAHPAAARQQGFGAWAAAPEELAS